MRCTKCLAEFDYATVTAGLKAGEPEDSGREVTAENTKFECLFCGSVVLHTADDFLSQPQLGLAREIRAPQVALTKLVDQILIQGGAGIFEAGTGVGKSYAYLLPAILNNRRTVISTAKKSLQSQLFEKDLPFLQNLLATKYSRPFKFAIAYGKSNYICQRQLPRNKAAKAAWSAFSDSLKPANTSENWWTWDALAQYVQTKAAAKHLPVLKYDSDMTAEKCVGAAKCSVSASCTYMKHKKEIADAVVVVTNHWLLGYHIRLTRDNGYELLGAVDNFVVDEAHKVEEGIRTAFTDTIPEGLWSKLVNNFERDMLEGSRPFTEAAAVQKEWAALFAQAGTTAAAADGTVANFQTLSQKLLNELLHLSNTLRQGKFLVIELKLPTGAISDTELLTSLALGVGGPTSPSAIRALAPLHDERWFAYQAFYTELRRLTDAILVAHDPNADTVSYLEKDSRSGTRSIVIAPIDVSGFLRDLLTGKGGSAKSAATARVKPSTGAALQQAVAAGELRSVSYLSATLAVAGKFDVFANRVGIPPQSSALQTALFGSAFDLSKQATLYIPSSMPLPARGESEETYRAALAEEIHALTEANNGNAFVLFTARDEMLDVARRLEFGLATRTTLPILVQDKISAADLLKKYRNTPNAVLFGLKSFWEGIDVAGDKLSLVIITKLPFPGRSDAIVNARRLKAGDLWFPQVDIPDMIFDLRQGIGRLIRTTTDTGVVAILDVRALTKNYSKTVLRSTGFTRAQTQREPILAILRNQATQRANPETTAAGDMRARPEAQLELGDSSDLNGAD